MKRMFIAGLVLMAGMLQMQAQVMAPAASPSSKIEQKVGLTDVTIEYSRPSAKGRTIFGDLVPYGQPWRAGANAATKVTFSTDVKIGATDLKAGSYALLITPNKDNWQFHFFNYDQTNWSSYVAEGAPAAVLVASAKTVTMPMNVESWTIGVGDLQNDGAKLDFLWEKTYVALPLTVPTEELAMASIEKTMGGPSSGDYYAAANYYLNADKDMNKALEWINKSIEMGNERFWVLRNKSLIQAKLGDKAGAVATAKKSAEMAREAGNDEYVKMNEASIKEWSK